MKQIIKRLLPPVALGAAVAALSWWWRYNWLPPAMWEDVTVAAGIHPPESAFPLMWHTIVSPLFRWLSPATAIRALMLAGHLALGLLTVMLCFILSATQPWMMNGRMQRTGWGRRVVRLMLMQGVVLFVCSDPVWEAAQVFGPTMFHLLMFVAALLVFVRFAWHGGRVLPWYFTMLILGMLAAETPAGVLFVILCLVASFVRSNMEGDVAANPLADPFVRTIAMRRMTLAAFVGWLFAVGVNAAYFTLADGFEALGWTGFEFVTKYLFHYVETSSSAATVIGWMLTLIVVVAPLALAIFHVGRAMDDEHFLPYWSGALFVIIGAISFLQLAGWRTFWFWSWTGEIEAVHSPLMRCLCSLGSAQVFTFALCVLGVEIYFRNYRRIAALKYQASVEDTEHGALTMNSLRRFSRLGRVIVGCEPFALLLLVVPMRMQTTERQIVGILHDCAARTVEESGDAKYLFTDGSLDAAIELCAAEKGSSVRAYSLVAGPSPRACYIRARGIADKEDREMLEANAVDALRTWLRMKPGRMKDVAMQIGFELWTRDLTLPECAGLVARPGGFPAGVVEAGTKAAHAIAERMLAVYKRDEGLSRIAPPLRRLFMLTQWRVARLSRIRADRLDAQSQAEQKKGDDASRRKLEELKAAALKESELADQLDEGNPSFTRIRQQLEMVNHGPSFRLTPREGLKLGLDRADFRMAEMFARQVLVSDPDDANANFALGMYYFGREQYVRAEAHFQRSLMAQPENPAILNNLAVAQLRLGRLDEAEKNARHALRVRPNGPETKRALENILKAKSEVEARRRLDPETRP